MGDPLRILSVGYCGIKRGYMVFEESANKDVLHLIPHTKIESIKCSKNTMAIQFTYLTQNYEFFNLTIDDFILRISQ